MDIAGAHLPTALSLGASAGASFAAVYGIFAKFDGIQSRANRHFVSRWLLHLSIPDRDWGTFFVELLAKFFGAQHWSLKCIGRSVLLSSVLYLIVNGRWLVESEHWVGIMGYRHILESIAPSFVGMLVINYLALWKTRLFLKYLLGTGDLLTSLLIVAGDFLLSSALYLVLDSAFATVPYVVFGHPRFQLRSGQLYLHHPDFWSQFNFDFWLILGQITDASSFVTGNLVAGSYMVALLTSAWLWAYVISAPLLRAVTYVPAFLGFLSKIANLDEHPVKAIGFVAALASAGIVAVVNLLL